MIRRVFGCLSTKPPKCVGALRKGEGRVLSTIVNGGGDEKSMKNEDNVPPVSIDTWEWVGTLMGDKQELTRQQAESLVAAIQKIAGHRLKTWSEQIVTQERLAHDMHLLAQRTQLLSRRNRERALRSEGEWRGKMERLAGELQFTMEGMRDLVSAARTETALAIGELKAEGREGTRRSEVEQNRLQGELATAVASFKSGCEHAKARATSI